MPKNTQKNRTIRGFRVRVSFTPEQETLAKKHAGCARLAYNWALRRNEEQYQVAQTFEKDDPNRPKMLSGYDLTKLFVAEVKSQEEKKWLYEVMANSTESAILNFAKARERFFKKQGGFPKFKKKGRGDSFSLRGTIPVVGKKIKVPKFGEVKLHEAFDISNVKEVTFSQKANYWFVSFKMDFIPEKTEKTKGKVGVDLGVKTLASLSDGTVFESNKKYRKIRRHIKLLQRKADKKLRFSGEGEEKKKLPQKEQSNKYHKLQQRIKKLHYRIGCIRENYTHEITSYLAKNHSQIVIEDLNVRGMSKNHKLASAILDGGFYAFKNQLRYKCEWYGSELIVADRFFASSKTCSCCGHKKEKLSLKERVFVCEQCGFEKDRDHNAALNLEKYAGVCDPEVSVEGEKNKTVRSKKTSKNASNEAESDSTKKEKTT